MQWLWVGCVVACFYGGGGVTKTSGIQQFWTDDYKVFDQIYGKTSDRDLYGETLPASITYGAEAKLNKNNKQKKERILEDAAAADTHISTYGLDDQYASLFHKQSLKDYIKAGKPTKSTIKYIPPSDFKPITKANDPETYNYFRHLEALHKNIDIDGFNYGNQDRLKQYQTQGLDDFKPYSDQGLNGFKPYANQDLDEFKPYGNVNYAAASQNEDSDGFKSIQDILEAHEANKGNLRLNSDKDDQLKKYVTNSSTNRNNKLKARYLQSKHINKPRCTGRCRKRGASYYRSRPVIRKIKHTIITK